MPSEFRYLRAASTLCSRCFFIFALNVFQKLLTPSLALSCSLASLWLVLQPPKLTLFSPLGHGLHSQLRPKYQVPRALIGWFGLTSDLLME